MAIEKINPITRLDYPDPDVIRVDETYYMVSTTMYFMPGCEILRSYDLVHWEHAAYVYDRLDSTPAQRLEGKENIYGQGMWAASLRFHDGVFYVCFVANDTHRTYLYTAKDITGPWEKSLIPGFYHDNSILFDDDGRIYIVYGNREIHITELCIENGTLSPKEGGLEKVIIRDRDDSPLGYEGAHFYKIDGRYYIFVIGIPGDTNKRTESCFVSDKPEGPYIGRKVMDDDRGYRNSGVAQGGIVQTKSGNWYSVLFQDSGAVGRIPVLVPISWADVPASSLVDGFAAISSDSVRRDSEVFVPFPVFGNNGVIPDDFYIEDLRPGYRYTPLISGDDFKNTDKASYDSFGFKNCWQFSHDPDLSLITHDTSAGMVTITTNKLSSNLLQARNTITQRTLFPCCGSSVTVDGSTLNDGDYAGLAVLESHYCFIAVTKRSGKYYLVMGKRELENNGIWGERHDDEPFDEVSCIPLESPVVRLCSSICFDHSLSDQSTGAEIMHAKNGGETYRLSYPSADDTARFFFSTENGLPQRFGTDHKLCFKLDHFTGARFALFLYSTLSIGGSASFSDFTYIF